MSTANFSAEYRVRLDRVRGTLLEMAGGAACRFVAASGLCVDAYDLEVGARVQLALLPPCTM